MIRRASSRPRRASRRLLAPALGAVLPLLPLAAACGAQTGAAGRAAGPDSAHAHAGGAPPAAHAGHHAHGPAVAPSAEALAQLEQARRAVAPLATPEAARAAGYRPMFGQVPLQGEHWVRVDLVLADSFDVARPPVLMFSPVNGTPTLVGVAYAYLRPTDAPPPTAFRGAGDVWHAHERLTNVPGRHLVMMHAWLTETPEGPFARYNPWLPYRAVGLTPPAAATLADSAQGERARRLGLALATAAMPPMLFDWLGSQAPDSTQRRLTTHREAILALVPRLRAVERDRAAHARLADEAIAHGEALLAAYRTAAPQRPLSARLVDRTVDEFMGRGHGIEEELGAIFGGGRGAGRPGPATRP